MTAHPRSTLPVATPTLVFSSLEAVDRSETGIRNSRIGRNARVARPPATRRNSRTVESRTLDADDGTIGLDATRAMPEPLGTPPAVAPRATGS